MRMSESRVRILENIGRGRSLPCIKNISRSRLIDIFASKEERAPELYDWFNAGRTGLRRLAV